MARAIFCSTDLSQLTSLHVLLWHKSGLALSHSAFKGSSIFAALATRDKIKLAHFTVVFLAVLPGLVPLREGSPVIQRRINTTVPSCSVIFLILMEIILPGDLQYLQEWKRTAEAIKRGANNTARLWIPTAEFLIEWKN